MSAVVGVNNTIFTVSENVEGATTSGGVPVENTVGQRRRFKVRILLKSS